MKLKEIFVIGIRLVFENFKFIWLFWLTNMAFALLLALPIYYVLIEDLRYSSYNFYLLTEFDFAWFIQFSELYKTNLGQYPFLIYGISGVFILIQTFYLGGLISVFNTTKKNHYVDFFYGGVKYWYRFTKVLLITLMFYSLAFLIDHLLSLVISYYFTHSESILTEFVLKSVRYILLIFLLVVTSIISDYTKVSLAIFDRLKIISEISSSMKFIYKNFTKVFTVYILVAITGALGAVVYNIIDIFIPRNPYYFLILSFIIQQFLIIFRIIIRMLFYSTEVTLLKDLKAEVVEV